MSYYFNLEELRREMSDARLFSRRFETMLTFKLNSLKELCGRLPRENEAFFIETKKSFTAFTFIVYLIKNAGQVRHLYIATYSTNERIINALLRWREKGLIGSIHLHISETIKFRMPKIYERLMQLHQNGEIELSFAWSHKKITCLDTSAGFFVVEGSGNYGENAMEEQYSLKTKKCMSFVADELVKWRDSPVWYDRIDLDEFERLAGIGYEPRQIAMYYHVPENDFLWYFNLVGSPLKYHYERGQLLQRAASAETGDNVTQAQRFDKFRQATGYRNSINKIFYDDIG